MKLEEVNEGYDDDDNPDKEETEFDDDGDTDRR